MIEIPVLRKYNSKFFDLLNGSVQEHFHPFHIHYKDQNGIFQNTDYTFEDIGGYWQMKKANYHIYISKWFDDSDLIRFDNRFNGANHSILYRPHSLRWVNNPDLSDMSTWRTAQHVQGVLDNYKIIYTDAFGSGIHFEITLLRSGFKKEIVFESLSSMQNPPTPNHRLTALFRYSNGAVKIRSKDLDAIDWDEDSYYESELGFTVSEISDIKKSSFIKPAYANDSNPRHLGGPNKKLLKVFWKKYNGFLWQAKILPSKDWFLGATFPIRADTVTTYDSGAGDGYVEDDASSWAACRSTSGTGAFPVQDAGSEYKAVAQSGAWTTGWYWIQRAFLPFPTGSLPATANISAASVNVYVTLAPDEDNDGYDYITVVQTKQASQITLVVADYNQCGESSGSGWSNSSQTDIIEGINVGERKDISSISTGAWLTINLNSTGISWIARSGETKPSGGPAAGWTLLGLREGHDMQNHTPIDFGTSLSQGITFYTSEEPGSYDPYLSVTYTIPGSPWYNFAQQT